jgi:hypothetical protein
MKISQLLNEEGITQRSRDAIKYLDIVTKPKEGRQHLTWKEKRREMALRNKSLRKGLTREEMTEYNDLNFIEVMNEGYALHSKTEAKHIKIKNKQREIKKKRNLYSQRRIQTRSMTKIYKQEIEKAKEESLKERY